MIEREVNMADSELFVELVTRPKKLLLIFIKRTCYDKQKLHVNHRRPATAGEHTFLKTLLEPTQKIIRRY
jgi:hypothetical protein